MAVEKLLDDRDIEDDLLGFHSQQAAEKMLKAILAARGVDYPRLTICAFLSNYRPPRVGKLQRQHFSDYLFLVAGTFSAFGFRQG